MKAVKSRQSSPGTKTKCNEGSEIAAKLAVVPRPTAMKAVKSRQSSQGTKTKCNEGSEITAKLAVV